MKNASSSDLFEAAKQAAALCGAKLTEFERITHQYKRLVSVELTELPSPSYKLKLGFSFDDALGFTNSCVWVTNSGDDEWTARRNVYLEDSNGNCISCQSFKVTSFGDLVPRLSQAVRQVEEDLLRQVKEGKRKRLEEKKAKAEQRLLTAQERLQKATKALETAS